MIASREKALSVNPKSLAEELVRRLVMAEPRIDLHDAQQEFVYADETHVAYIGGIGSGKTWSGAVRSIRAAKGWIGNTRIPVPNLGVVTAATYDMLRDATIRAFYEVAGDEIESLNRQEMRMVLKNGSEILFRTASHPERLRGPSITWWYGDEAALYIPEVRRIMIGRLRQFGEHGFSWITSTPKGRNWVWQVFIRDAKDNYRVVRSRTVDNPFLAREFIEDLAREYVGDFARQELDAEFVAFEGLIYADFSQEAHVTRQKPTDFKHVIGGVDWGYANPGVLLVIGIDWDGRAYVVRESYKRAQRVEEWASEAVQLRDLFGVKEWYCDPSEPDNIRVFQEAGLKAVGADNSVLTGIQKVKNRLVRPPGEPGEPLRMPMLVIEPDCVNLISEFEQYQWMENVHGLKDAPVKANDHAMDALRYAIMGLDYPQVRKLSVETKSYIGR